ncbi:MAG: adenylosuccinate lyase [Bacteroidota bacterium]
MSLHSLTAISPLDGRYHKKVSTLGQYFSEYALIKYRVRVEVLYLLALCETNLAPLSTLSSEEKTFLESIYTDFTPEQAEKVKKIEAVTNHDVKAVEYFIKEAIEQSGLAGLQKKKEFVHFGLTSQDINNTAIPLMLKEGMEQEVLPTLVQLISLLSQKASEWKTVPMLARTHGQVATPTTMGKEIAVFVNRLLDLLQELDSHPFPAKFGGATGNLNAHYIAYPEYDWNTFSAKLLKEKLGLVRSVPTTQIEHYDGLGRIFDTLKRINTVLIDLCQDIWLYVSRDYFLQKRVKGEVGSSTMPHKINPIDFENAEGNCGLSTAMLEYLSRKLPISRLQRDLTDSTVLRNIGVGIGYAYLAYTSILKGLSKITINREVVEGELEANWIILAEAVQTILRREQFDQPYEILKAFTQGKQSLSQEDYLQFIQTLEVSEAVKEELSSLRPSTYLGNAHDWPA